MNYKTITINKAKSTKPNRTNLYLRYSSPTPNHDGKFKRSEALGLFEFTKARTPEEREHNKLTCKIANARKLQREQELNQLAMYTPHERELYERAIKSETLLTDFIKQYHTSNNTPQTIKHVQNCFGELFRIKDITSQTATDFAEYMQQVKNTWGEYYKSNSVRLHVKRLVHSINKASKLGLIPPGMCENVKLPKERNAIRKPLNAQQIQALREDTGIKTNVRFACLFALYTGLRVSDIVGLRWNQIKNEGEKIYIELHEKKTNNVQRLPLNSSAIDILNQISTPEGVQIVFYRVTPNNIYYELQSHCKRSGVEAWSIHQLRHTFATELIRKGVDIYTISKLLGHSNITTTQLYLHCFDDQKESAVNMLTY